MDTSIKMNRGDIIFNIFNYTFLSLLCLTILLPFIYLLAESFDRIGNIKATGIYLWPQEFTIDNYLAIAQNTYIWKGYLNTVIRTVVGTILAVIVTAMGAYALAQKCFPHRTFWTLFVVFTMFFSGGIIPTYLWIDRLHLIDNRLVLILPYLVNAYNLVLIRNFFQQIPAELQESARIDGASEYTILFKIILPVSKPIIATIALWLAVGHWNAWFDCLLYIKDTNKYVLQVILQRIILQGTEQMMQSGGLIEGIYESRPEVIKAACIFFTMLPILCVYPFIQKYFVKGIFIGSIKG
ncbi:MAG TPA: ABC transporter permease [Bacteroidales bacterium]|nr:ABC transporter permease [Bacteroidales bacterium]